MSQSTRRAKLSSGPPPLLYSFSELARGAAEAASLAACWPGLQFSAPAGDGHSVMVLPGFMADDGSTAILRAFLRRLGYRTVAWKQGRNMGASAQQKRLVKHVYRTMQRESAPITLIGQSLGGVYARELARQFPESVRMVISLGSPFGATHSSGVDSRVSGLVRLMSGETSHHHVGRRRQHTDQTEAPPVPCTAIYSKTDGVVSWQSCLERAGDQVENVELCGSHIGMSVHPHALHVIADRLVHDRTNWRPFDRSKLGRQFTYPKPFVAPD